ncbi:MAG TPA: IS481 family transposase [Acidimicrobiia bacterium]|jgi:transposase InsO family protein|nr:IS481 family transposase [Acidimicrobiia bacterium]
MHRNAPLTAEGRLRLCHRIEEGWSVAAAAESMNISRQTAHKWWRRYREEGMVGLEDRSSRPWSCPHRTPARVERRIVALRQSRKLGPARLAGIVGVPASTVHRVLVRHGMNRLRWLDRPTGRLIRRIETSRPGELVHIDVKKLARVPMGGGHRKLGRSTETKRHRGGGYTHIHTAIDAYSRLAYSEFAGAENEANCVAFLDRAVAWFTDQGITIERILTDNGNGYRSHAWRDRCAELGIRHTRTRPYRPATNGKVERFNRTLLDEWAYARIWRSDASRARTLDRWLHRYNHHRHHTAIDGPPVSRINNQVGQNS